MMRFEDRRLEAVSVRDLGGIIGSAVGGLFGDSAADAQAGAAAAANRTQRDMFGQSRNDQMPWLASGGAAVNQLAYLMGLTPTPPPTMKGFGGKDADGNPLDGDWAALNGSYPGGGFGSLAKSFTLSDFEADPGYAFRLSEGAKALERSQSAKGGLLSGAAGKEMLRYGQGMGSQEFQNAYDRFTNNQNLLYNRLAGIANTGQVSAQNLGSLGANAANQMGENYAGYGNARAGQAQNWNNMFQTGLGYMGNALGGGGGSSFSDGTPFNWFQGKNDAA